MATGGFDPGGFDNVGFWTGDVGAVVTPPVTLGGGGKGRRDTALIAPFIKWGKKKKKPEEAIAEVAAAIRQTASEVYVDPVEADALAAHMLAKENLAQLRRIQTIEGMIARIERERMEMDDEEVVLLLV